jgi:hypothetical protein
MPNTSGGLPYPAATEPVAGGAAAIQALAVALDDRAGVVNADGTRAAGTLFTSVKNSTGQYTVTFTPALASRPAVIVQPEAGSAIAGPIIVTVAATHFIVQFRNTSAGLADQAFAFQAQLIR